MQFLVHNIEKIMNRMRQRIFRQCAVASSQRNYPFWVIKVFFGGKFWTAFGEVERRGHFLGGGWCQLILIT